MAGSLTNNLHSPRSEKAKQALPHTLGRNTFAVQFLSLHSQPNISFALSFNPIRSLQRLGSQLNAYVRCNYRFHLSLLAFLMTSTWGERRRTRLSWANVSGDETMRLCKGHSIKLCIERAEYVVLLWQSQCDVAVCLSALPFCRRAACQQSRGAGVIFF